MPNSIRSSGGVALHLSDDTAALLSLPDADRVRSMSRSFFIHHAVADTVCRHTDFMINNLDRERVEGLVVYGGSGRGKSSIARMLIRRYPGVGATTTSPATLPPIYIDFSGVSDYTQIYVRLLKALGQRPFTRASIESRADDMFASLALARVQLIIMDEVQDLLVNSEFQTRRCLHALRRIMNVGRVPIVLMGNDLALQAVHKDEHLAARFENVVPLQPWKAGPELARFLDAAMQMYPLHRPSDLSSMSTMKHLVKLSGGNTKRMRLLMNRAAMLAVEDGTESITADMLQRATVEWPLAMMGDDLREDRS